MFEIPKVQVEDSEALRKEIGEKHAALIGQLSEASTSNKKLAEQRAINAGLDLVLAKLDEQIIEYQKFVHFMEDDAKASGVYSSDLLHSTNRFLSSILYPLLLSIVHLINDFSF